MLTGKVESVMMVEHIVTGLDLCSIVIDFDELKIFGDYNEILNYLGKYVQYNIRKDMYKGQIIQIVASMADIYTVQTLEAEENIKLIPKDLEERQVCNFSIDALKWGDYDVNCVAYLSSYEIGASKKTRWVDCQMVDRKSKVFNLRMFIRDVTDGVDTESVLKNLVGRYVKFDINSTKYGYQTDCLELYNVLVVLPPEVDIAISQIRKVVANDQELVDYMEKFDFINTLQNVVDIEPGYHLVAIAAEIYFIKAIGNISSEYNMKTLIRASITSRGYLLPVKTKFSRAMLNTNKVLKSALLKDRELILLLDVFSEEEASSTKKIYIKINKFVKEILDERRGLVDEESSNGVGINLIRREFGELL